MVIFVNRLYIFLVCFFIGIFNVYAENDVCKERHCVAVVDAGSSGSRLHIFAFDVDSDNSPIKINEIWSKKIKPGFATVDLKQDNINSYLDNLFLDSPEKNIPVYFYATAGMRLLSNEKQQLYYQALARWFKNQNDWQLIEAKTITGSDEGIYGWLSVNYQLGSFNSDANSFVNVMDIGGASVQVTFPVDDIANIAPEDLKFIDLYGKHINLFAKSFLGLGQTLITQQFINEEYCFADGYKLPNGLYAKGDAISCEQEVAKYIVNVHEVNKIVQPALLKNFGTWYVIGGAAALADEKLFSFDERIFTSEHLLQQGNDKICHQSWQDLTSKYPSNDYLYGYCLFPSYYYALFVDGYGIDKNTPINVMLADKSADWTLGVVLQRYY